VHRRAIHYYVRTYANISVVRKFFICAIHYKFVKMSYVCAARDDRILVIERLLQWACSLSSVWFVSLYLK